MSQTEDEFRAHLIEVGRDAMGRNDGWRWWHPRHLARLLDVWEPLIRVDDRKIADCWSTECLTDACADCDRQPIKPGLLGSVNACACRCHIRKQVAEEIAQAIDAEHVEAGMFCCFSDQRHVALVGAARVARWIGGAS